MPNLFILLIIFITALVALLIWNLINFNEFKNQSLIRREALNDSKYWELKYKFESFLILLS